MKTSSYLTYSELLKIKSFEDRFKYLALSGTVAEVTFGGHRQLNQILYHTQEWQNTRREVIIRDSGNDLAHIDHPIGGRIYIHHMNPITIDDILKRRPCVFDLENLVSCSFDTHNAIHYGNENVLKQKEIIIRMAGDTTPWKSLRR